MQALITVESTRASFGGTSRSVTGLCGALQQEGVAVRLVAGLNGSVETILPSDAVETVFVSQDGSRATFPLGFYRALRREVSKRRPDIVHDNGVWRANNWVAATVAAQASVPLVLSTRGMLTQWALRHHGRKKRLAWSLYQRRTLDRVSVFHATSAEEAKDIRLLGLGQPIAVIPNGVTMPPRSAPEPRSTGARRALFMSRIHPKKGLPMLIEAWALVRPRDWTLDIAGPDEGGHRSEIQQLVSQNGLSDQVRFIGDVPDSKKWSVYEAADLFILPSHSENFGIAIAEALAARVPVITTTGTPWSALQVANCGWWVPPDVQSINVALRDAVSRSTEELDRMGERGRALIEERFSWRRVARDTVEMYEWICGNGPRPEFMYDG